MLHEILSDFDDKSFSRLENIQRELFRLNITEKKKGFPIRRSDRNMASMNRNIRNA